MLCSGRRRYCQKEKRGEATVGCHVRECWSSRVNELAMQAGRQAGLKTCIGACPSQHLSPFSAMHHDDRDREVEEYTAIERLVP